MYIYTGGKHIYIYTVPVIVLYTRLCPSALAVTNLEPVVLNVTSKISSVCPLNVCIHVPLFTSQTLHVRSILPEVTKQKNTRLIVIAKTNVRLKGGGRHYNRKRMVPEVTRSEA